MLPLAADEDFNNHIVRGIVRKNPNVDIVRVQDAGLSGTADPMVLEWVAAEGRVLLTHDVNTMTLHAYQRAATGDPMPGLVAVPRGVPISDAIEDVLLIAECGLQSDFEGQVQYLPLL